MENIQTIPGQGMQGEEKEEFISLMEIATLFIKHWKWILLGLIVALMVAFLYLRYTTPVYNITANVVLKEEKNSRSMQMPGSFEELAMMGAVSNVENETYILRSRNIIRSVINRLDLHTSYIVEGRVKSVDLYTGSPVIVDMAQADLDELHNNIELEVRMLEDAQRVEVKGLVAGSSIDTVFSQLPALLMTKQGNISFTRRESVKPDYRQLYVTIQHPDAVIGTYRGNLTVAPASRTASVLNLSLNTPYPQKGRDFLNMLVEVYNNEAIEDKNQEARNTQQFIEERIAIIDRELSTAEQNVEEYKREEGLTDIQTDLQRDMQMGSNYEQQLVQVETQLNVVNSLNSYVNNPANQDKTIPANVGIEDPTLATTSEYNRLLLEKQRLSQSMTEDNPAMKRINEQIAGLRQSIGTSISSVQQGLQIQRRDARNQANIFGGRVSAVPTQEREFMELSREQQIKASLFLMLLQKREENALVLAAYANKAKVLDEAALEGKVSPRTMIVLLAALMLGILLPAGIIYLMDMLQYRIRTRGDVDRITKVPVLGEIPKHDIDEQVAVQENETRAIDEAFRMLRTNLLLTLGADNKVVVFTSTVSGEGKTFIALNTAISLSLLNKKVLLMGMDLRIPRLKEYMNLKTRDGITSYLSGFEKDLDRLIVPSGITDNLFVLPSGAIPPNPAELMSRPTLDKAIAKLREDFDFILIDSAPSSQVTDTLILNRVSDATVYVCRANYSSKGNLRFANEMMQQNRLKNMVLVVNDVDEFHHAYGYGYGRGYRYGYKDKKKKK